eukprot:1084282-Prorocentrum_lima.AAC.1
MDVQEHRPVAQSRGVFRTVVLEDNCALWSAAGSAQTEPSIHYLWLKPWAHRIGIQAPKFD